VQPISRKHSTPTLASQDPMASRRARRAQGRELAEKLTGKPDLFDKLVQVVAAEMDAEEVA